MSIKLLSQILDNPIPFAHALGYTKLTEELHKDWIIKMVRSKGNYTLQAHRGSYKTTCLIVAIGIIVISKLRENTIFLRKTSEDVKDVITSVSRNMQKPVVQSLFKSIYGIYPNPTIDNTQEYELSSYQGSMGRQLLGMGLKSSITGKHGSVFTDDIVTVKDRVSTAARDETKSQYTELINIASEENQNIFNTGTPWHKDDAFTIMPKPEIHTVYQTGILSPERIAERKAGMTSSLFAANYELKHIADGDILFPEPKYGEFPVGKSALAHIDAAYGGEDRTALTIIAEVEGKLHTIGWMFSGHIENHYKTIISKMERFQCHGYDCENNADKGYLRKDLSRLTKMSGSGYHEKMNKYYKISTYGKARWKDVIFDLENGDPEYIAEIMDYNENASYDDAPDSFASLVKRRYYSNVQSFH